MSKVVVLGGSGFIGTRLVKTLRARGHEVIIGDKRRSEAYPELWRACDVTVPASLPDLMKDAEFVVNLAAEHRDDVRPLERYHEVNVHGAEVVCEAASALGIKHLVFTSSVAVYGLPRAVVTEDDPCEPFNEYGRTKLLAEQVYRKWRAGAPDRSLAIVRPTVVFGEGNRGNVYNLLQQIHRRRFIMVGSGRNRKSLAYVGNVAEFLAHVLSITEGEHVWNYVDSPDLDMTTLTSEAAKQMGIAVPPIRVPYAAGFLLGMCLDAAARATHRTFPLSAVRVKKFCASTRFSAERAQATGFTPGTSLLAALAQVIQHEFPAPN